MSLMNRLRRFSPALINAGDKYSSSESGDGESDEDCADDTSGFNAYKGWHKTKTAQQKNDFIQSR